MSRYTIEVADLDIYANKKKNKRVEYWDGNFTDEDEALAAFKRERVKLPRAKWTRSPHFMELMLVARTLRLIEVAPDAEGIYKETGCLAFAASVLPHPQDPWDGGKAE